jgi:addiction module RelE/StbE family toxin
VAEVVWTRPAIASLDAIRAYIGQFSPLAAQRMAIRLVSAGMSLASHPERGRSIGRGRRELATVPPYLILYRVRGEVVEILAIRHGARRPE